MIRHAYRLSETSNFVRLNLHYRYLKLYYNDIVEMCRKHKDGDDGALDEVYNHPLRLGFNRETIDKIFQYACECVATNAPRPYNEGIVLVNPVLSIEDDNRTTIFTPYGKLGIDSKFPYINKDGKLDIPHWGHLELQRCTDTIWYLLVVTPEEKLEGDEDYYDEGDGKPHDRVDVSDIVTYNNYHTLSQVIETRLVSDRQLDITGSGLSEKDPIHAIVRGAAYKDKYDATITIDNLDIKVDVQADFDEIKLTEEQYLYHVGHILLDNGVYHLVLEYHREADAK